MIRTILFLSSLLFMMNLQAAPIAGNIPDVMPEGDYKNQCRKCSYDSSTGILSCRCPDLGGRPYQSTLDLTTCLTQRVELKLGYLVCNNSRKDTEKQKVQKPEDLTEKVVIPLEQPNKERDNGLPAGDYLNYCNSCTVINGVLQCDCWVSLGITKSLTRTTIPVRRCSQGNITYAKGNLICVKDLGRILNNRTCENCQVQGNTLKCNCKKTPCQWSQEDLNKGLDIIPAKLASARYCTKNINNCNGILRCGRCGRFDYLDEYFRPHKGDKVRADCPH